MPASILERSQRCVIAFSGPGNYGGSYRVELARAHVYKEANYFDRTAVTGSFGGALRSAILTLQRCAMLSERKPRSYSALLKSRLSSPTRYLHTGKARHPR